MSLTNSPAGAMDIVTLCEGASRLFTALKSREDELYECMKQALRKGGSSSKGCDVDEDIDSDSESEG